MVGATGYVLRTPVVFCPFSGFAGDLGGTLERDRQRDRNVVYYNMVRKKVNGFGADLLDLPPPLT